MRIVFYCGEAAAANVVNYLTIGASGTVSALVLASHGLSQLGHEVIVLNRSESGTFGETRYINTESSDEISERLHDVGPVDVFIANGFASEIFKTLDINAGKRAAWIHNFVDHLPYEIAIREKRLDYVICISHNQLGTWWRSPVFDHVAQIYNCIDTTAIDSMQVSSVKEKKMMFIGAPRSSKGFHDALRIFDAFAKRNLGFTFYVAGAASLHGGAGAISENGVFEKDYEESHLKKLLYQDDGKLRDDVVLLGKISRNEVLAHLGSAVVAIQNPGWESEPEVHSISALEAQAMGVPVLSSFRGGQPEAVIPGRTGILLTNNNLDAAVQALESLTRNHNVTRLMPENAKRHVREKFQVDIIANDWDRCLGVMSRGGRFTGNFIKAIRSKIRHKLRR